MLLRFTLTLIACASAFLGVAYGQEEIPVGKLAFVTGPAFGSEGSIQAIGAKIPPDKGSNPAFSSDGAALLYSVKDSKSSVVVFHNLATTEPTRLRFDNQEVEDPALSPDGARLAYVVWPKGRETSHICVCNMDGSSASQLTSGEHYDWSPKWSPDGSKIVFESTRDGQRQIYLMDADGANQKNLTNDKTLCHAPAWSPDGTRIAFMQGSAKGKTADIFTINIDGSEKKAVLEDQLMRDSEPDWSPDGNWLVFTRSPGNSGDGPMDLWIMRPDGSDLRQITHNREGICSYAPTWGK